MIRAAHRTYSNDVTKQDVKVNSEFTRNPASPANRWRSSLRSTPKERNGTVPKSSYRNFSGKENLVDMNRAQQNGPKPIKGNEPDKKDGRKIDKKDEIADKAKRKFRENLSKFQRESKQADTAKSSPFQRSYRKDTGAVDTAANAYRRSCRAPPVSRPVNLDGLTRRSLRRERANETTDKSLPSVKNSRTKTQPLNNDRSPKERDESDRYSTTSSAKATVGSLSSRPSSASSTSTSASVSDSSSRGPSSGKKLSRAELAMERHMERMRKASSPSAGSTFGNSPSGVAATKPKSRQTIETDPLEGINATKLTFTKENLYSPPPQKTHPPRDVTDPSLSKIEEGLKSLDLGDDFLATLNLDDLDVFHTSPVSKLSTEVTPSPTKSSKILKSPSYNNEWSSVQIIEDYVFEPSKAKTDRRNADSKEIIDESPSSPVRPVNRSTSRDTFPPISKPLAREHPSSPLRPSEFSRTAEHTPRDDDVEINCSVEEAIDTFRKLSEEIDTLKNNNFGKNTKSKAQKRDRGKSAKTPEIKAKTLVKRKESIPKSDIGSVKRSVEVRTLGNVTATRAGSRANGSASETGAAQEKLGAREKREMTSSGPVLANAIEGKSRKNTDRHLSVGADASASAVALTEKAAVVKTCDKTELATEPEIVIIGKSAAFEPVVKKSAETKSAAAKTKPAVGEICNKTNIKAVDSKTLPTTKAQAVEVPAKTSAKKDKKSKEPAKTETTVKDLTKPAAAKPAASKVINKVQEVNANANQAKQQRITVDEIDKNMSVRVQQRGKLSGMSAAEKRARLRRAVLKYQQEDSSSSDESVFSDASSSDDEVSASWLDTTDTDASVSSFGAGRKKKASTSPRKQSSPVRKSPQRNGEISRDHTSPSRGVTKSDDVSGTPDASKLKAMWETKLEERKAPVTSTPINDIGLARSQPKVSDAKSAFEAPLTPVVTPSSPPRSESGDSSEGGNKLGSMLSMWENKKGAKMSAYDASTDEAFDRSTMGRLQGAKALFHNMSKQSPTYQKPRQANSGDVSPKPNTVSGAKSVFENISKTSSSTSPPKSSPVAKKPVVKPTTRVRQATISDESDFDDEDLSDVPTLSSTSSSDDEMDGGEDKVNNVRRMWENKSVKNKPGAGNATSEQDTKQAWDSGSNESR